MGRGDPPTPPEGPAAHFQYSRPPRDRFWALLFLLTWLAVIGAGAYGVAHRNPAALTTDYTDPASCPLAPGHGRGLLARLQGKAPEWSPAQFAQLTGRWLAASAVLALGLGWAFIQLFKSHAHAMTRATIYSQVLIPVVFGVMLLASGAAGASLLFFGLAGLAAFCFHLWRDQVQLATKLLGVSAHALAANSGVITATLLLNLGGLLAIAPLGVLTAFALMNGEVVPNPARDGRATCTDDQGHDVLCCTFAPNGFGQGYTGFAATVMLWTMLLANQIRVFTTSGAVAQWYFAPPGLTSTRGTTLRSLKHALGPQFGSCCLGSLVLTVAEIMRSALENAQQRNDERELSLFTLIQCCLIAVAQCFWAVIEYLTKFATVMMAISGEAFMDAGRCVTDLLARNLLNAFASTIWFTPLVIRMACFLLAAGWGALTGAAYYALHHGSKLEATPGLNATLLGAAVYVVAQFILAFLGGILLSVLDAVFICWALDKDSQTVSHPEVYAVLETVPLPGAVVEQPDGGIMYGAGQPGAPPQGQYQPPTVAHV